MKRRDAIFAACSSAVVGRGYSLKRVASAENSN